MKNIKFLLILIFIYSFVDIQCKATTHCGGEDFYTGEEHWDKNRIQYNNVFVGQYCDKHDQYARMDMFNDFVRMEKENSLGCPVNFSIQVVEDIMLTFSLNRGDAINLKLFIAFNEAMVEIFNTGNEVLNKSKYVRADLEVVKNYISQVLLFFEGVRCISSIILKRENVEFNEGKFLKSLNSSFYVPAENILKQQDAWINKMRLKFNKEISLSQYLDFYLSFYSKLFHNNYIFTKAHLMSQENNTRMALNRKLDGGLKDFEYNLTNINLLDGFNTFLPEKHSQTSTSSMGKTFRSEKEGTHSQGKKKKRKKRRNKQRRSQNNIVREMEVASASNQLNEKPKFLPETATQGKPAKAHESFLNTETNLQPITSGEKELSLIIDEAKNEDPQKLLGIEEELVFPSLVAEPAETSPPHPLEDDSTFDTRANLPIPFSHQVKQLQELDLILNQFDGGPKAGMKTRKFLRLCSALNDGGFFSDFKLSKKEVLVKTEDMVSVMHTNHSGKKKDAGITRPTAKKLQEVIEQIRSAKE